MGLRLIQQDWCNDVALAAIEFWGVRLTGVSSSRHVQKIPNGDRFLSRVDVSDAATVEEI
jgi:hypothetical protein